MFSVKSLESQDYEEIRNAAIKSIERYCSEWSNYNASDTGIALIELLAWMQEMQQFYLDSYGEENIPLYLELLGLEQQKLTPSKILAQLDIDKNVSINKNTAFFSETLRFESEYKCSFGNERLKLCRCVKYDGSLLWECSSHKLQYGAYMFGEIPAAGNCFYMGLDRAVTILDRKLIYFEIGNDSGLKRNPISDDNNLKFAVYKMEYWDGSGWLECKIIKDETMSFIQSGFIYWTAAGEPGQSDGLYWIRIRLLECDYDIAPYITAVNYNKLSLVQRETVAASEHITLPVSRDGIYCIDITDYFDDAEVVEVYVRNKDLYFKIDLSDYLDNKLIFQYDDSCEETINALLVVRREEALYKTEWEADGFPNQTFELGSSNIYADKLQVLVEDNGMNYGMPGQYSLWKRTNHFWNIDSDGEYYRFDGISGSLIFGDGVHGKIPEGRIVLIDCVKTMGADGVLKKNNYLSWGKGKAYSNAVVSCGTNSQSADDCLKSFSVDYKNSERAVTAEDYERIAAQTPGLIINRVKAIGGVDNSITLVVECNGVEDKRRLPLIYRREIIAWLNNKRLLGTQIKLKAPEYFRLYAQIEVDSSDYFLNIEHLVKEAVYNFFQIHMNSFGAKFQYSALYGMVDSLECVRAVSILSVTSYNKKIKYQRDGSFKLPECGLAVLDNVSVKISH